MSLDAVRIVLVETSHPGNIGSTARAMKTMGLHQLYLVSPHAFPDVRAHEMAAGADDLLETAVITRTLQDAIKGCHLVIGSSARPRHIALTGLLPKESAALAQTISSPHEIAFVFGREQSGLTNDELLQCHYHVHIPSDPTYSSLNLSQAVQIIAYELRMACLSPKAGVTMQQDTLATVDEVEQFYAHLREVLIAIDFLNLANPKRLFQRIRRLFNRAQLEHLEINILRGILSNIQRALKRNNVP